MDISKITLYVVVMISSAVFLSLGGWYTLVRVINSFGTKLKYHRFVAIRHLKGRKSGFLTAIGILAIWGVTFSSCTLTTVLSVMGGFSDDLKQKIINTNAHVVVDNYGVDMGMMANTPEAGKQKAKSWRQTLQEVRKVDGVAAASPVVKGEAMINARSNNHPVQFKGIETTSFQKVSKVFKSLEKGKFQHIDRPDLFFKEVRERRQKLFGLPKTDDKKAKDNGQKEVLSEGTIPAPIAPNQKVLPAIIVGKEMANALRLYIGEEVNVISPHGDIGPTGPIPKSRPFRVAGIFFTGMYEFDNLYAYTSIKEAQKFFRKGDTISEIQVSVKNPDNAIEVAKKIESVVGKTLRVRPWQEMNASLFSALKLEKIVMFIFLSLAILVASFCIVATLSMLVIEKGSEISVLMTLGSTASSVMKIFRFEGLLIGIVGTTCGLLVGLGLCLSLKYIGLPIDPEVWYIDKLPVKMSPIEFLFVGLASLGITLLATMVATVFAAKPSPVEGLKNG